MKPIAEVTGVIKQTIDKRGHLRRLSNTGKDNATYGCQFQYLDGVIDALLWVVGLKEKLSFFSDRSETTVRELIGKGESNG